MRALALCLVLVSAAGCTPSVRSGWFACGGTGGACPSGWLCLGGRCYPGDTDAGPPECRVDMHCDDSDPCTEDVCEAGRCQHNGQSADCDDGNFCNGPDECNGGHCLNVGPSPCPATCDGTSCAGCGHSGESCCPGDVCSDGVCDTAQAMCVPCGSTAGSLCCLGDDCGAPDLVCNGTTCKACGGDTQPCCTGGVCTAAGLECSSGGTCGPTAGCMGVSCGAGLVCSGGGCVACGIMMGPCCAGDVCSEGVCDPGSGLCLAPPPCGGLGDPCCATVPECSVEELVCASPPAGGAVACLHCGEPGEPCCRSATGAMPCIDAATACGFTETCEACGAGEHQVCCPGGACPGTDATYTCVMGFCHASCGGAGEPCCTPGNRCGATLTCIGSLCQ